MSDPPFRVVAEQSEADTERNRTGDELGFALRDLTWYGRPMPSRGPLAEYPLLDPLVGAKSAKANNSAGCYLNYLLSVDVVVFGGQIKWHAFDWWRFRTFEESRRFAGNRQQG